MQEVEICVVRKTGLKQFDVSGDHGQKVVEVMRDTPGELADRVEPLRVIELLFQCATLGQILDYAGEVFVRSDEILTHRQLHRKGRSVLAQSRDFPDDADDPFLP